MDYYLHLYCYFHNVSADMSSNLLQVLIELGNLHKTSNYVFYWIHRGRLFWRKQLNTIPQSLQRIAVVMHYLFTGRGSCGESWLPQFWKRHDTFYHTLYWTKEDIGQKVNIPGKFAMSFEVYIHPPNPCHEQDLTWDLFLSGIQQVWIQSLSFSY